MQAGFESLPFVAGDRARDQVEGKDLLDAAAVGINGECDALIDKHLNPREVYTQYLIQDGEADAQALAKEMEKQFLNDLQERLDEVKQNPLPYSYQQPEIAWKAMRKATAPDFDISPVTGISTDTFTLLFEGLMKWPAGFNPLRKVDKLLKDKVKLFSDENKIDWATAELMAYGSLLIEGKDVRTTKSIVIQN